MIETKYEDVAGADQVKQTLDDLISKPIRYPHLFTRGVLKASRSGILLFGPPGTGKTMLARAVAAESGASFIAIGPAAHAQALVAAAQRHFGPVACTPA